MRIYTQHLKMWEIMWVKPTVVGNKMGIGQVVWVLFWTHKWLVMFRIQYCKQQSYTVVRIGL